MLRFFKYTFCAALLLSLPTACKRQSLCSDAGYTASALVEFLIDWGDSNIEESQISNVSIYAYPDDGTLPYIKVVGSASSATLALPAGDYSLLLFNEFVEDVSGVTFFDIDSFSLFSAQVTESLSADDLYYEIQEDQIVSQTLEAMAAWQLEGFTVSEEAVQCSYCDEELSDELTIIVEAAPTPRTTPCVIELGVENLDNAAYVEVVVVGLASAVTMVSGERSAVADAEVLYSTTLSQFTYSSGSGSDGDGVAWGSLNTFGKLPSEDQTYQVIINVVLSSGTLSTFTRDVTAQILDQDNSGLYIDLTSDEDSISLPAATSSGFGVESWDDNERVDLL
ncbi:MAG: DUF5119 domain-containing protein [Rikenellaceae bacterium]